MKTKTVKVKIFANHNSCGNCGWLASDELNPNPHKCTLYGRILNERTYGRGTYVMRCAECTDAEIGR